MIDDVGPDSPASETEEEQSEEEQPPKQPRLIRGKETRPPTPYQAKGSHDDIGRRYIPDEQANGFILQQHRDRYNHADANFLVTKLLQEYSIDNLWERVEKVVKGCKICQKNPAPTENDEVWQYLEERLGDYPELVEELRGAKERDDNKENTPPNWVDKRLAEWKEQERVQRASRQPSTRRKYYLDYRNANHASMSWTACIHDTCVVHYSDKMGAGWFPKGKTTCRYQWFDCTNDECEMHLWDKREKPYFPGKEDPAELLAMQMLINGSCNQTKWQTCLHPECTTHWQGKKANGYGKQTFLGQHLAPGIDPGTAPLQTQNH
jgi:hypothetical protein